MKKAMLFIVSMLFALNVSAGSMVLTNTVDSSTTGGAAASTLNTLTSLHGDSGAFLPSAAINDAWDMAVVADVPAWVFRITSNQDADPFTASINGGTTLGVDYFVAVAGEINFWYSFLVDGTYSLVLTGIANASAQTSYDIDINEVPVPAALFLFAPALLGFFGLRRKATLAA